MTRQIESADFFDAVYFGHQPGEIKSNYGRVGGYQADEHAAPQLFVDWVVSYIGDPILNEVQETDAPLPAPRRGRRKNSDGPLKIETQRAQRILEIGCATGATVNEFVQRGYEAFGIDYSMYILSRAAPEVAHRLAWGDMRALANHEAIARWHPFDVIVSKDVLEHLYEDEVEDVLRALGKLAPLQLHVVNTGQHEYQAFGGDVTHHTRQPLDWWQQQAERAGVKAIFKET